MQHLSVPPKTSLRALFNKDSARYAHAMGTGKDSASYQVLVEHILSVSLSLISVKLCHGPLTTIGGHDKA